MQKECIDWLASLPVKSPAEDVKAYTGVQGARLDLARTFLELPKHLKLLEERVVSIERQKERIKNAAEGGSI